MKFTFNFNKTYETLKLIMRKQTNKIRLNSHKQQHEVKPFKSQ
jgi:hypothetical protein